MKKFMAILIILLGCFSLYSAEVAADLRHAVNILSRFPEGKRILDDVEKSGKLQIFSAPFNSASEALWNPVQRAIVINANYRLSVGCAVRSILFELHNALSENELYQLDKMAYYGSITKDRYVSSIEKIEYENVIKTNALIEKAISQGYFPLESRWFTPGSFQEHFAAQIELGHSQQIANNFDRISAEARR